MIVSAKLNHAVAASLSVALAYLLPLYFGISDVSTAAITVMVIAANDSLSSSLEKGIYRALGTLLGAVFGIGLIALFPQDRFLYLSILGVCVTSILYIARAYRGDKTIFLLFAMTMMLMFDGGQVDNIFLYAANKTLMTLVGIGIYTFVSMYIFPVKMEKEKEKTLFRFVWFDFEDIKATLLTFLVYCISITLWIYFEISYGFYIVILATSLSLYTTFSVASGFALSVIYTLSFFVAILAYIFVLPYLEGWWELSLFLFIYSFFGFYFIPKEISIFYLLGISTFMIQNEMVYDFALFLFILLIFYLFLFVLLIFDYFPFNQKSEYMFLLLRQRFIKQMERKTSSVHIEETLQKMRFYAQKIDANYFGVAKEELLDFCDTCLEAFETKQLQKVYNYEIDFNKLKESKF